MSVSMDTSQILSTIASNDEERDEWESKGSCFEHREEKLIFYCPICSLNEQLRCVDCMIKCNESGHKGIVKIGKAVGSIEENLEVLAHDYNAYGTTLTVTLEELEKNMKDFSEKSEANKEKVNGAFKKFQTAFKRKMEESMKAAQATDEEHLKSLDSMAEIVDEEINRLLDLEGQFTKLYQKICRENDKASRDKDLLEFTDKFQKIVRESKVTEFQIPLEEYIPDDSELNENIEDLVRVEEKDEPLALKFRF